MPSKSKEDEVREILTRIRILENQIANAQAQLQMLERGLIETSTTKTAVESLKQLTKDTNSLLPLGSGMFARGILAKQDKILVDVGAGAIVEKDLSEAAKILDDREKEIKSNMSNIQQVLLNLEKQYNDLADKARSMAG